MPFRVYSPQVASGGVDAFSAGQAALAEAATGQVVDLDNGPEKRARASKNPGFRVVFSLALKDDGPFHSSIGNGKVNRIPARSG